MSAGGDSALVLDHLKRSFTDGDNHYEGQFWYAREMLLQGHAKEADRLFKAIHERAPGRFRTRSGAPIVDRDGNVSRFSATVDRVEEGYAFFHLPTFGRSLFGSRGDSDADQWVGLKRDMPITGVVSFSRRGPRLTDVQKVQSP